MQIDATAFDDASGNSFAGIADTTTWNFTSIDLTSPSFTTLSPVDGGTGVLPSANLVITFDEAVDVGTGNISIYDGVLFEAIDVTLGQVTGSGTTTITINPSTNLADLTDYYVQIAATAFDDASGNDFVGIADTTTWNFQTADITPPSISTLSPVDGAADVSLGTNLVVTFNEVVVAVTGNVSIYDAGDTLFEAIDVTSGQVTGSGTTAITINPSTDLAESTGYYVQIDATAFDDTSGNDFAGIADTTTWNFTSLDLISPSIITLSPVDGATGVSITSNLVITFDEAVNVGTGNVSIYDAGDTLFEAIDVASGQVTGSGTATITINPATDLADSIGYYVQIDATAFDDTSASANGFAGIADTTTWNFSTNFVLASAEATSNTSVKVYFSSDVGTGAETPGNYKIPGLTVDAAVQNADLFIVDLTTSAHEDINYTLTVTGVIDTNSYPIGSQNSTIFAGDVAPYIKSVSSHNSEKVVIYFSEAVDPTNATYGISPLIPVDLVTIDADDRISLATTTTPQVNTLYTLTIGLMKDLNGNDLVNPTADFTGTGDPDITEPRVLSAGLVDNNTVYVQFSEPVKPAVQLSTDYLIIDNDGDPVTVTSATRQTDESKVVLVGGPFTASLYMLTVQNVTDIASNTVDASYDTVSFAGQNPIPETLDAGPLMADPMAEGTNVFSMLTKYKGRIYMGPSAADDKLFRVKPDGSDPELVAFRFFDTDGINYTTSLDVLNLGPDGEDGIDYIAGGTVSVDGTLAEALFIGPSKSGGDLNYLYFTTDSGSTLDFRPMDLTLLMGPQSKGVSSMIVFNNNLYVAFPDSGGKAPYLLKIVDAVESPVENNHVFDLIAKSMPSVGKGAALPGLKNGAGIIGVDSFGIFGDVGDENLYLANGGIYVDNADPTKVKVDGGIVRSTTIDPAPYPGPGPDWEDITPTGTDWDAGDPIALRSSIYLRNTNKLIPAEKAFPAMAVFNGDLYTIRNTEGVNGGPQLWKQIYNVSPALNTWTLVAENGATCFTNMGDPLNTSITLLIVNGTWLYIGYDNVNGVQIYRTNVATPGESDFTQVSTDGFGDAANNKKIYNGVSIASAGTDYLWILTGGGADGKVRVYRTNND